MICGQSGTGKTRLLKKVIRYLGSNQCNIFVIDFHGDIETPFEEIFEFTTINSLYGMSIFEFDAHNTKSGGIYPRIQEIIQTFKKSFMPSMGAMQEAVLKQLIIDVYRSKGYEPDNPNTWQQDDESLPTLDNMMSLMMAIESTVNDKEMALVQKGIKESVKLAHAAREADDEDHEWCEENMIKKRDETIAEFTRTLELISTANDASVKQLGYSSMSDYPDVDLEFYQKLA
jgi:DNA helicase HerA-like ATPase